MYEQLECSEIEQSIIAGLYDAFNERRPLESRDLARAIQNTVPLSVMLREDIKLLREWARHRARRASSVVDLGVEMDHDDD